MMTEKETDKVLNHILNSGIVCVQTDTLYGFICNSHDCTAVDRLYWLKKRESTKAYPVFFGDIHKVKRYAILDELSMKLSEEFWPGSLTIVLDINFDTVPHDFYYHGSQSIAIRIPKVFPILDLISKLGLPLVSTSANVSGYKNVDSFVEIMEQFRHLSHEEKNWLLFWDIGMQPTSNCHSTIVKCNGSCVEIIRKGQIGVEEINRVIGK